MKLSNLSVGANVSTGQASNSVNFGHQRLRASCCPFNAQATNGTNGPNNRRIYYMSSSQNTHTPFELIILIVLDKDTILKKITSITIFHYNICRNINRYIVLLK